jgi:hypothetical protein
MRVVSAAAAARRALARAALATRAVGGGSGGVSGAAGALGGAGPAEGGDGGGASISDALLPMNGWVSEGSNTPGIQGALFDMADQTTRQSVVADFSGSNACIRGTAARVELPLQLGGRGLL